MLTKGEFNFINYFVRQSCVYWTAPLDWDKDLNLARSTKSKWKRISCIFNTIVGLVTLGFSASTLHISVSEYRQTHRLDGVVIHCFLILTNFVLCLFQITLNLFMGDLIRILNSTVLLNQEFGNLFIFVFIYCLNSNRI